MKVIIPPFVSNMNDLSISSGYLAFIVIINIM